MLFSSELKFLKEIGLTTADVDHEVSKTGLGVTFEEE
jgi:hypothetical protein